MYHETASHLWFTVTMLTDIHTSITRLTTGLISLKENIDAFYEYMRVLASHLVNLVPPDKLCIILVNVKWDMKAKLRLELPDDPDTNLWAYYSVMKKTSIVMDNL